MTTPQELHHALLRPCVLHILRAAGYHTTRPSVLDTLTDLAARYLFLLAQATVRYSVNNGSDLEPTIVDVRMALQNCGALGMAQDEEELFAIKEDMQGMEEFQAWIMGKVNKEIQRIALEGDGKEDYLTGLSLFRRAAATALTPGSSEKEAQHSR
jgi:transcription initiation factor TFIID subunit 3